MWLLYPVEPSSNAGAALSYAEQYARSIPGGREKSIFFISSNNSESLVNAASERLRPAGIKITFIQVPNRMTTSRDAGRVSTDSSRSTTTETRVVNNQPVTGPGNTTNSTTPPGTQETSGTDAENPGGSDAPAVTNENSTGSNENGTGTNGQNNGITDGDPWQGSPPYSPPGTNTETGSFGLAGLSLNSLPQPLLIGAGFLLLLIVAFIIIMMARNLHSSPNKVMASANSTDDTAAKNAELLNSFANRQAESALQGSQHHYHHHVRDDSNQFLTNPPMLNLFVEEQNTAIGRRNVHALKKGSTFTVGGGKSDYLIFLVPLPNRLGKLYFDGTNCTFTPLKPRYFPDLGSTPVTECIGKAIRILSDKNYEIFFHFERYKDPLIVLNQLLHSISVPEAPLLQPVQAPQL
jgi:hypothetical protein